MRTFLFLAALSAMFIVAIVAGYNPSTIEKEYNRIKEPIEKHFAERQAETWRVAKNREWEAWVKQIRLPADCSSPRSAVRELECKNQRQLQVNTFERIWSNKVSSGWKPEGID